MITAAKLKTRTVKELASMAKKKRITGWHSMRKDDLIKALVKEARSGAAKRNGSKKRVATNGTARKKVAPAAKNGKPLAKGKRAEPAHKNGQKPRSAYAERRLRQAKKQLARSKDLAVRSDQDGNGQTNDRLVALVRDPFWLHAYWELTRASVERARAAMGQYWHAARPTLRVNQLVRNGTTSTTQSLVRDIEIHGGVNNWYIDVKEPPKSYQLEIGYLAGEDRFFSIARSNVVTTPRANSGDAFDQNWAEVAKDFDRVYAMSGGYIEQEAGGELKDIFEKQLQRPMGPPMATRFGLGAARRDCKKEFNFAVETELIVHGTTDPDAHVTLRGEPVHLRADGSFAVRFTLPDRRHVLPVVASSGDGVEQRTIVLAVDRNTKVMEPVIREPGE